MHYGLDSQFFGQGKTVDQGKARFQAQVKRPFMLAVQLSQR